MSDLLKINVNDHIEKKNGLSYLSWAWAWAEVLKIDPQATWAPSANADGLPVSFLPDGSAMVSVSVTIKGHSKACFLPVMNHRNQAIKNPDAFAINTAIMRCLAKAIAMHGLGLYIYAGEDLPEDQEPKKTVHRPTDGALVSEDEKPYLQELAAELTEKIKVDGDPVAAYNRLQGETLEAEQKSYLWSLLASDVRSAIKKAKQ